MDAIFIENSNNSENLLSLLSRPDRFYIIAVCYGTKHQHHFLRTTRMLGTQNKH